MIKTDFKFSSKKFQQCVLPFNMWPIPEYHSFRVMESNEHYPCTARQVTHWTSLQKRGNGSILDGVDFTVECISV